MAEKYRITTEKGTYIIETEDIPAADKGTVSVDQAKEQFRRNDTRTGTQVAVDQLANVGEGAVQFVKGIPGMVSDTASMAVEALNPMAMQSRVNRGMQAAQGLKSTIAPLANDAAALVSSKYAPSSTDEQRGYANFAGQTGMAALTPEIAKGGSNLVKALANSIPSKTRAGLNFQQVMGAARNEPLNLAMADDAALRAQELAGRGGIPGRGSSLPKVMRDYLRTRESNPGMTYEVGRDFQSAAGRLSSAEAQAANPVMKSQVSKLAKALAESNREAAVKVGMGDVYDAAMKEYRQASRIADLAKALRTHAPKAAIGSGVGYGLYKALGN